MKPGAKLATALLTVVSIAHLLRVVGCLLPGAIAVLLWREGHADTAAHAG